MTDKKFEEYSKEIKKFVEENPFLNQLQENLLLKLDITEEEMRDYCFQFDNLVDKFYKKNPIFATEIVDELFILKMPDKVKLYFAIKVLELIREKQERQGREFFKEFIEKLKGDKK